MFRIVLLLLVVVLAPRRSVGSYEFVGLLTEDSKIFPNLRSDKYSDTTFVNKEAKIVMIFPKEKRRLWWLWGSIAKWGW